MRRLCQKLLLLASLASLSHGFFVHEPKHHNLIVRGILADQPARAPVTPSPSLSGDVYSLHVSSRVRHRFASTQVRSRVANPHASPVQALFQLRLPDEAFIANFSMTIAGETIVGRVAEAEEAKADYDQAVASGRTAGLVARRHTNAFQISVTLAPKSKASFNLTYHQILSRRHGLYAHVVNVRPGQVVSDLRVEVELSEAQPITDVHVPAIGPRTSEKSNDRLAKLPAAEGVTVEQTDTDDESHVRVVYAPSKVEQGSKGLDVQLVTLYDVEREEDGGELEVVNGYFLHFFAPARLPETPKQIVFVLDKSGSMIGTKIRQVKTAMGLILKQMSSVDEFGILAFSDEVEFWKPHIQPVTSDTVAEANHFVRRIKAAGGTNIDGALQAALDLEALTESDQDFDRPRMILFLTDGQPTSGLTTDGGDIVSRLREKRRDSDVVHAIAFGADSDFALLTNIAASSRGVARKVYEDSDAALQLEGFFGEISKLLLTDVKVSYLNESVQLDSLVRSSDYNYYSGGELMTMGRVSPAMLRRHMRTKQFEVKVEGRSADGPKDFRVICPVGGPFPEGGMEPVEATPLPLGTVGGDVERMWAYLSIKKLLKESKLQSATAAERSELREKALRLSLKYGFVTELTSMVVTDQDGEGKRLEKVAEEGNGESSDLYHAQASAQLFSVSKAYRSGPPGSHAARRRGPPGPSSHSADSSAPAPALKTYMRHRCNGPKETRLRPGQGSPASCPGTGPRRGGAHLCGCTAGFLRHEGRCVEPAACPPALPTCSANETLTDGRCFHYCDNKCDEERQVDSADCPVMCDAVMCVCKEGFVRSKTGACVRPLHCPGVPAVCPGPNERLSDCPVECPNQSCATLQLPDCEQGETCPPAKCVCDDGFVRSEEGSCVRPEACSSTAQCANGETRRQCGKRREKSCATLLGSASSAAEGECVESTESCGCAPGLFRSPSGACVEPGLCPGLCGRRERLSLCATALREPRCFQPEDVAQETNEGSTGSCFRPGCVCEADAFRHPNGSCVTACGTQVTTYVEPASESSESGEEAESELAEVRLSRRAVDYVAEEPTVEEPPELPPVCVEHAKNCRDEPLSQGRACEDSDSCGEAAGLRWHYDRSLDSCVAFHFRGCGGNGNRHASRQECMSRCLIRDKVCSGGAGLGGAIVEARVAATEAPSEEGVGDLPPPRPFCANDSCPQGFVCRNGVWTIQCCNATLESWFSELYKPTCVSGAAKHSEAPNSLGDPKARSPLYSTSCDLLACPSGFQCQRQSDLFVACCQGSDSEEAAQASSEEDEQEAQEAQQEEEVDEDEDDSQAESDNQTPAEAEENDIEDQEATSDEPPRCAANEKWAHCPSYRPGCDASCANRADPPVCVQMCGEPRCVCKPGFLYNSEGACVRESECPQEESGDDALQTVEVDAQTAEEPQRDAQWEPQDDWDSGEYWAPLKELSSDRCDGPGQRWRLDAQGCRRCFEVKEALDEPPCPKCPGHAAQGELHEDTGCFACQLSEHDTQETIYPLRVEVSSGLAAATVVCVDVPLPRGRTELYAEGHEVVSAVFETVHHNGQELVSIADVFKNTTSHGYHVRARELGGCGGKASGRFVRELQLKFPDSSAAYVALEDRDAVLREGIFGGIVHKLNHAELQMEDPEAPSPPGEVELVLRERDDLVLRLGLRLVRRWDHVRRHSYQCYRLLLAELQGL